MVGGVGLLILAWAGQSSLGYGGAVLGAYGFAAGVAYAVNKASKSYKGAFNAHTSNAIGNASFQFNGFFDDLDSFASYRQTENLIEGGLPYDQNNNVSSGGSIGNLNKKNRSPVKHLDVEKYYRNNFRKEFSKLTDPDLIDNQTRTYIELAMENEIYQLQQTKYGYRTKKRKKKQQARMESAIQESATRLYANLTKALSKYSVLVRDMEELPELNVTTHTRGGVYANN